ncbi:MAG: hypothetical protein WKF82_02045 [Nocardioidaceae bacterium]
MSLRDRQRPVIILLIALGLLAGSLALLYVGRFIQFDDYSGFGSYEAVMPLGILAGPAATVSVIVATAERMARRLFGGALIVLDAVVVWQATTNDGFRFIWVHGEGELFYFQIGLGMTALVLMTPTFFKTSELTGSGRATRMLSGWARVLAYLGVSMLVAFSAFFLGAAHFESTECSGPDFGGECDVALIEGLVWAAAAIVVMTVAVVIMEVVRVRKSRRPHEPARLVEPR